MTYARSVLVLIASFFLATASPAALLVGDLVPGSGDGLLTIDTETDLQWLDLTATSGQSINEVLGGFGGYVAMGFEYATLLEVEELFLNAGIDPIEFSLANAGPAFQLIDLLGQTQGGVSERLAEGYAGLNQPALNQARAPTVVWRATGSQGGGATLDRCCFTFDQVTPAGSFLVRPIPEPATGLLVALGLLGIALAHHSQA